MLKFFQNTLDDDPPDDFLPDDDRPEPTEEDVEAALADWERHEAAQAAQAAEIEAARAELDAADHSPRLP